MSRKFDAAIAEALGYEVEWVEGIEGYATETGDVFTIKEPAIREGGCIFYLDIDNDTVLNSVPCYSTDGNAMLELDREMVRQGFIQRHIFMTNTNDYEVTYYGADKNALKVEEYYDEDRAFIGRTSTMPEAVALAAYKALTGKEWGE